MRNSIQQVKSFNSMRQTTTAPIDQLTIEIDRSTAQLIDQCIGSSVGRLVSVSASNWSSMADSGQGGGWSEARIEPLGPFEANAGISGGFFGARTRVKTVVARDEMS